MKKIFAIVGIFVIAIVVGTQWIHIYEQDTEVTKEATKVGVLLNGSIDDRSWSQSHYEGLECTAMELNLEMLYAENAKEAEAAELIEQFVEQGCKIIIANSFGFGEAVEEAAAKYPEIYFLHATGVGENKNLSTYFGRMYQIRYLSGIVAGLQTETDEIGYVAAFPISEVNRGINAFTLGVRSVNPDAKVYVSWINSWTDDEASETATYRLMEKYNIDVLAMHTDSVKPLEIAEKEGIMSIGYNVDNSRNYPNTYLTAAVWDWEEFYTPTILRCLQGKFEGKHYWESVSTGIVSLAPYTDIVNPVVKDKVAVELERLNSGTYDVFYGPIEDSQGRLRIAKEESMTDNAMLNEFDWYVEGVVLDEE
ncbi:MAG: BMP family ABC transporter substrate-binding protein [Lachnospiraceae bacterium]|nr:BMP family ABC transporter substrate-binding protein [Lachnospiraceae bacterium]